MYFMILLILDDVDQCTPVLDAWETAGVAGITILESTGLGRARKFQFRDDFPLMPSLSDLMRSQEERHRTLFTVVEGDTAVDRVIAATQTILGDLDGEDNGVIFVLPVARVVGLHGAQKRAAKRQTD